MMNSDEFPANWTKQVKNILRMGVKPRVTYYMDLL